MSDGCFLRAGAFSRERTGIIIFCIYTVRRKMCAINNFRELSTFANIIIRELYVRTYTVEYALL